MKMTTKVVNLLICNDMGKEFITPNISVSYNEVSSLKYLMEDMWTFLMDKIVIGDIYINEPIYNENGEMIDIIPIMSLEEGRPKHTEIKFSIKELGIQKEAYINKIAVAVCNSPKEAHELNLTRTVGYYNGPAPVNYITIQVPFTKDNTLKCIKVYYGECNIWYSMNFFNKIIAWSEGV